MAQPITRHRQAPTTTTRGGRIHQQQTQNQHVNQANNQSVHQPTNHSTAVPARPPYAPRPKVNPTANQQNSSNGLRIYSQPNNQSDNRSTNRSHSDRYDTSIEIPPSDNQSFRFRRSNISTNQSAASVTPSSNPLSRREIKLTSTHSIKYSRFVTLFFVISCVMIAGFGLYTIRMRSVSSMRESSLDQSIDSHSFPVTVAEEVEEPLPSIHDQSINPEYIPPQPPVQPVDQSLPVGQDQQNEPITHNDQQIVSHQPTKADPPIDIDPTTNRPRKIDLPNPNEPTPPKQQVNQQSVSRTKQANEPPIPSADKPQQSTPPVAHPRLYGNIVPVPLMTESVFPHDAKGHPLFSPPSSVQYSSFYCVGGRGRFDSAADRACRFQNLCFNKVSRQWLFYQDPALKGKVPIMLDHGQVVTEFANEFLNLRSLGASKMWSPKQVYEAIPASAIVPRKHQDRSDVYLLYDTRDASNLGFILGDDFFPLFNLVTTFGMLTNEIQLLMTDDCDSMYASKDESKAARCKQLLTSLGAGMSNRPILATSQKDFAEHVGMDSASSLLCFENVLAGNGPWGFQQSLGKAPTWWQYHHFYLSNMGLAPNYTPKNHRITVSVKEGNRAVYNNEAMVAHLKKAFPGYSIDAVELYKLGGWQQELAYLRDTTVLITPCGAVSMPGIFLPHGAAIIVVDYWNTNKNNTGGMEEKLWSNLGYVRPYHYPFVESEVILDKGKDRNVHQHMRDWGRVNIDLKRMELLVRDAIRHVDSFMVMGRA